MTEAVYNPSDIALNPGWAVVYGFLNYNSIERDATPKAQLQVRLPDDNDFVFTMSPEVAEVAAQLLDRITLEQCKGIALLLRDGAAKARLDLVKFNKGQK